MIGLCLYDVCNAASWGCELGVVAANRAHDGIHTLMKVFALFGGSGKLSELAALSFWLVRFSRDGTIWGKRKRSARDG